MGTIDEMPWYTDYLLWTMFVVCNVVMFIPFILWIREGDIIVLLETEDQYRKRIDQAMKDESWWRL